MQLSDLSGSDYMLIFAYLFLPILLFGLFLYASIILSNRMGGKSKLAVFFLRVIFSGAVVFALAYYFYWFATEVLVG